MSPSGHSRQGRARSKPGHVCCALKAEVISKHGRLRDGPLRVDGAGRGQHSTDAQSRRVTERLDLRCHCGGAADLPVGQISLLCRFKLSSPICKNISLRRVPKSNLYPSPSRPTEGRLAIVTDAGRDAVDAEGAVRRTALDVDGEVVWS